MLWEDGDVDFADLCIECGIHDFFDEPFAQFGVVCVDFEGGDFESFCRRKVGIYVKKGFVFDFQVEEGLQQIILSI